MPKAPARRRVPRSKPPVPVDPTDPLTAKLTVFITERCREALNKGDELAPVISAIRAEIPLLIVAAAAPGLASMVDLAIRVALEVLEGEAKARLAEREQRRRRKPRKSAADLPGRDLSKPFCPPPPKR